MKLAERMRELRKEKNLRQEDAAAELNISMSAYCRYELGMREPAASVLWRMADYYDVTVDYLLGRSDRRITQREFEAALDAAQSWAVSVGYKEEDVDRIIKEVRKAKQKEDT